MKKWQIWACGMIVMVFLMGISLNAEEKEKKYTEYENGTKILKEDLQDAFIIAMEDDDGEREGIDKGRNDDEDRERERDNDDDDDDFGEERLLVPRNMEELWEHTFEEVDELNPEQTQKFYKENFPFIIKRAEMMLRNEPREVVNFLENELDQYEDAVAEKKENPQRFEAWVKYKKNEFHSMELAEKIRLLSRKENPTAQEQQEISARTEELRKILGVLFELRMQNQKREIEHLQREVKNVETQIKRREKNRDKIIQKKLDQMTGKEDDLAW